MNEDTDTVGDGQTPPAPGRPALPPISADARLRLVSGRATGSAIAKLAGGSRQYACRLLRQGRSALQIVEELRGPGGRHRYQRSTGQAGADGVATDKGGGAHGAGGPDPRSLSDLQKEKMALDVARKQLELYERRALLLPRQAFEALAQHVAAVHAIASRELMALPAVLRDRSTFRDGVEVELLWFGELQRVLESVRRQNEKALEQFGYPPPPPPASSDRETTSAPTEEK